MEIDQLKELIDVANKYKISTLSTDNTREAISILANTYIYTCNSPHFSVESPKDVEELRKRVIQYINAEECMGEKIIDVMENRLFIRLSTLRDE